MVGKDARILYKTKMTVNVTPFSDDFGMIHEIPVVHAAVSHDYLITGNTTILVINNALYIREMEHNLLPPIIMRLNGILVDKCPKFLCPKPTIETHSIFFPIEDTRFPLSIHSTTSYISTRRPRGMAEVNEHINLILISEHPDWDPSSPIYVQQEDAMKNWNGDIRTRKKLNREVLSVKSPLPPRPKKNTPTPKPNVKVDAFTSSLLDQVNISSISSSSRHGVSPETLAEKWDIGLTTVTTQHGVRTVDHPSLQRLLSH